MNKEKLVMYFRIKILQMNGPNYEKKYPGVRVSKGKEEVLKNIYLKKR